MLRTTTTRRLQNTLRGVYILIAIAANQSVCSSVQNSEFRHWHPHPDPRHTHIPNVLIKSVHNNRLLIKSRVENELRIPFLDARTKAAQHRSTAHGEREDFFSAILLSSFRLRLVPTQPPGLRTLRNPVIRKWRQQVCSELVVFAVAFAFWSYAEFYPLNRFSFPFSTLMHRMCACARAVCWAVHDNKIYLYIFFCSRLCASFRIVFIICSARCWIPWTKRKLAALTIRRVQQFRFIYICGAIVAHKRMGNVQMELFCCDWHYLFTNVFRYYTLILCIIAQRYLIRLPVLLWGSAAHTGTRIGFWIGFRDAFLLRCAFGCNSEREARGI